jgi:hypothetical protein
VIVVFGRNRCATWFKIFDFYPFGRERKYFRACALGRTLR